MTSNRLSVLQCGRRRPRLDELESIAKALNATVEFLVAGTDWQPEPPQNHNGPALQTLAVANPPLRRGEFSFDERLRAAWKLNPYLVRELERKIEARPNSVELKMHLQKFWVDSGPESIYWMQIAAADSYPVNLVLPQLGLRDYPIVCPGSGIQIGDLPRPGLWLKTPISAALFPQITIRPGRGPQRVDCLACFGANRWVVLEVDGKAHNSRWDELREQDLKLPVWRLSTSDVQDPKMLQGMLRFFHRDFPLAMVNSAA